MLAYQRKLPRALAAFGASVAFLAPGPAARSQALPAGQATAPAAAVQAEAPAQTGTKTETKAEIQADPGAEAESAATPADSTSPSASSDTEADAADEAQNDTQNDAQGDTPSSSCLTRTICAVKDKIRWQAPAWTPSQCQRISDAVATSAKAHDLSPTLLLAIMINESDMNEKAQHIYTRKGKVYAKDGGLMAIRCVLDERDRCRNGEVRGLPWKQLMDPVKNIELGARLLAHYRDGGGVMAKTVNCRDKSGHLHPVVKQVVCNHKNHAFWAHYNHGPRYIERGYPRHYPQRVAVLDRALATVMNVPAPELERGRITIRDPGMRERTPDRPVEARFKKLKIQILSSGSCAPVALN